MWNGVCFVCLSPEEPFSSQLDVCRHEIGASAEPRLFLISFFDFLLARAGGDR